VIKGVSRKKIDIYYSDLVAKINCKENNFLKIFDFPEPIDHDSKENIIAFEDGVLDLYIKKKEDKMWDDLVVKGLSKEEIRDRRKESFKRKDEAIEKAQTTRESLKWELD